MISLRSQKSLALVERGAGIILDEAHAIGGTGACRPRIAVRDGVAQHLAAVVHTCGKALASASAFACGTALFAGAAYHSRPEDSLLHGQPATYRIAKRTAH